MVEIYCDYCKKPLSKEKILLRNAPSKKKRNKHNFCCRECADNFRKKHNKIIYYQNYAEMIINSSKYGSISTKIDLEDVEKISKYTWSILVDEKCNLYYVRARINNKMQLLHRFIMTPPKNKVIDHINHNTLDNRKSNLRVCTTFENNKNNKSNTSGHVGVYWHKQRKKWCARIKVGKKCLHLGLFSNINDAIKIRIESEKKYYS